MLHIKSRTNIQVVMLDKRPIYSVVWSRLLNFTAVGERRLGEALGVTCGAGRQAMD